MFPQIKPNAHRMLSAVKGKYAFPWDRAGQAADVFPGPQTCDQLPAIPNVPRKCTGRSPDAGGRSSAYYNIHLMPLPKLSEIYNPVQPSGQTEMKLSKPEPPKAKLSFPSPQKCDQLPTLSFVPRKCTGRGPNAEGRNSAYYNIQLETLPTLSGPKVTTNQLITYRLCLKNNNKNLIEIYNPVQLRPSGQTEMKWCKPAPPKAKMAKDPPKSSSKVQLSAHHCTEVTRPSVPRELPRPDPSLNDAFNLLSNNDWEKKIKGINLVRSLSMSHPTVVLERLHALSIVLTKEVKNLCSQVSRAAIGCVADLFIQLGKAMDREVEHCARVLLSRAGDSNLFIREEVDRALQAMVDNVTSVRSLTSLINGGLSHVNAAIRSCAAKHLCHLVERMGQRRVLSGTKTITERAVPAIARCAQDGSQDTRFYGRKMLHHLKSHPDFENCLRTYVPGKDLPYIKNIIKHL